MKKTNNTFKKVAILLMVVIGVNFGCKKEGVDLEAEVMDNSKKTTELNEIVALKSYLSKLTNIEVNDISYDEKSEQFIAFGVNQISRTKLLKSYINNTK